MTIKELYERLELYIRLGKGDNTLAVRLKERSVGQKANSPVKGIYNGIDWDNGLTFIQCDDDLISYKKDRDKPQDAIKIIYTKHPETRPVIHCPNCENKLHKADRYCSSCGQRVSMDNLREFKI